MLAGKQAFGDVDAPTAAELRWQCSRQARQRQDAIDHCLHLKREWSQSPPATSTRLKHLSRFWHCSDPKLVRPWLNLECYQRANGRKANIGSRAMQCRNRRTEPTRYDP
jgi:hypothetical protein